MSIHDWKIYSDKLNVRKSFRTQLIRFLLWKIEKLLQRRGNSVFGTGRTNDFPSEVILFLIFQSKKYPRFCCMAQDYIILGFSADKRNVYKAELEHDFSTDKDKLEICSNYVTDGNERHGIGSVGLRMIVKLARMLGCKEINGRAESYLDRTKGRLRNISKISKKNSFAVRK